MAEIPEGRSVPLPRPAYGGTEDPWDWTWPPGDPLPAVGRARWTTLEWAPPTTVRRPLVRLGRWTLLYRRPGC